MSRVGETASASFNFSESAQLEHRLQASIEQRRSNNSKFEENTDKGNNAPCKYITRNVDVHKYLQIHDCIITTTPEMICDINLWCKSCYLSKLCATKDLTTQIGFCPCLATNALKKWIEVCLWKLTYVQLSTSHEFRVKKVVTQHVLITSLLPVKSIWAWGTRRMSYTMNFSPPVCISSFLLETVKWKNKANNKMRVRINENFSLTWLTFKCICWWYMYNEVCN